MAKADALYLTAMQKPAITFELLTKKIGDKPTSPAVQSRKTEQNPRLLLKRPHLQLP